MLASQSWLVQYSQLSQAPAPVSHVQERTPTFSQVLELILSSFFCPSSPQAVHPWICYQPCTHKILTFPTLVSSVAVSPIQAPAQSASNFCCLPLEFPFSLCRQGQLSKIHAWLLSFPASTTPSGFTLQSELNPKLTSVAWSGRPICRCPLLHTPPLLPVFYHTGPFVPWTGTCWGLWTPCWLTRTASSFSLLRLSTQMSPLMEALSNHP